VVGFCNHRELYNLVAFLDTNFVLINLNREGCRRRMQSVSEPSLYLYEDRRKTWRPVQRWPTTGLSECTLALSQQSGEQENVQVP
jgi:hypothetical protein